MKDFVKMTLAVICGLFLMSFVSFFMFFGFIGALASSGGSKPILPRSGILKIDMSAILLSEKATKLGDPMAILQGDNIKNISLWNAVQAINIAAEDPGIKFIYLKSDNPNAGLSHIEELRKAIENFRKSGKAVISYIENPSTASYYLASVADKVLMSSYHGSGSMITGIGTQMFFLKDILDKFGVNVQLIRHGKYKSAGEMFIKNSPSPENLEQTKEMVNSIWETCAEEIAQSRGMDKNVFSALIDNLALVSSEDMLSNNLVDELVTKDQIKEKLGSLSGETPFKAEHLVSLSDYIEAKVSQNLKTKNKIAILTAEGEIVDREDLQNISGDSFAKLIAKINADSSIKAVVLRVASPGGSVLASDKIKRQLDKLGKDKLLVASFGSFAASGGYWISNNCERIFSDNTTLTGSIGVFSIIPDFSKTAKDILHIGVASVGSNKHSDMYSLVKPLDTEEKAYMQKSVEDIYDNFVKIVSEGRDMRPAYVDSIAQGRVWTGRDALRLGLVDEIGTLEDAVKYAAAYINDGDPDLSTWNIESYPEPKSEFEALIETFSKIGKDEDVLAGTPFKNVVKTFRKWDFEKSGHTFARMPYEYIIK